MTNITSKGQTTVPHKFRKLWKARTVIWETCPDGSARVSPAPELGDLFGSAKSKIPRNPQEKSKARAAWGK
jgi:bifunctional DNA-binding transcriptional regulator/antitoxin component of YhaV-PrlF toxin-antitoxin module